MSGWKTVTQPKEETWQQRWARGGARVRADWLRFFRVTIPGYAELDDEYEALQTLYAEGAISEQTLAVKAGALLENLDALSRPHVLRHKKGSGVIKDPPPQY